MPKDWTRHPVFQEFLQADAGARTIGWPNYKPGIFCNVQGTLITSSASLFHEGPFQAHWGVYNFLRAAKREGYPVTIISNIPNNSLVHADHIDRHFPPEQVLAKTDFTKATMGLLIDDTNLLQALVQWDPKKEGPVRDFLAQFGTLSPAY